MEVGVIRWHISYIFGIKLLITIYTIWKFENFILGIRRLAAILTRFYPLLTQGHIFWKQMPLNFDNVSHRLTNSFGKRLATNTEVHLFGIRVLLKHFYLNSTILKRDIALWYKDFICAKFYSDIFFGTWFLHCNVQISHGI